MLCLQSLLERGFTQRNLILEQCLFTFRETIIVYFLTAFFFLAVFLLFVPYAFVRTFSQHPRCFLVPTRIFLAEKVWKCSSFKQEKHCSWMICHLERDLAQVEGLMTPVTKWRKSVPSSKASTDLAQNSWVDRKWTYLWPVPSSLWPSSNRMCGRTQNALQLRIIVFGNFDNFFWKVWWPFLTFSEVCKLDYTRRAGGPKCLPWLDPVWVLLYSLLSRKVPNFGSEHEKKHFVDFFEPANTTLLPLKVPNCSSKSGPTICPKNRFLDVSVTKTVQMSITLSYLPDIHHHTHDAQPFLGPLNLHNRRFWQLPYTWATLLKLYRRLYEEASSTYESNCW